MTSLASVDSARASAVICWVAMAYSYSGRVTSTSMSSRRRIAAASRFIRPQSMRPKRLGSRLRKTFSATDRNGTRLTSW